MTRSGGSWNLPGGSARASLKQLSLVPWRWAHGYLPGGSARASLKQGCRPAEVGGGRLISRADPPGPH